MKVRTLLSLSTIILCHALSGVAFAQVQEARTWIQGMT